MNDGQTHGVPWADSRVSPKLCCRADDLLEQQDSSAGPVLDDYELCLHVS